MPSARQMDLASPLNRSCRVRRRLDINFTDTAFAPQRGDDMSLPSSVSHINAHTEVRNAGRLFSIFFEAIQTCRIVISSGDVALQIRWLIAFGTYAPAPPTLYGEPRRRRNQILYRGPHEKHIDCRAHYVATVSYWLHIRRTSILCCWLF